MAKCIYCNSTDISESDIIPVSLTNAKITRKNVCRVKHNNEFGKTFESDVINKLTFLRDHLDITTKSKKYPETTVEVKVDDIILKKNITKNANVFGNHLISSVDNNSKVGPIEKINQLADSARLKGNQVGTVTEIDMNEKVIETHFPIDLTAFISESSKRLVAKMAYEWFCYVYNVEEYLNEFTDIIDFICGAQANTNEVLVTYVADARMYEIIKQHTMHGSHTFMAYESDTSIDVLVSFFGICIYNVRVLNKPVQKKFNKNCFLHEFQLSAKRNVLEQQTSEDFYNLINKALEVVQTKNGPGLAPKEEFKGGYNWQVIGLYYNVEILIKNVEFLEEINELLINEIIKNLTEIMNGNILHLRNLKRFVKECISNNEEIRLNPHAFGGEKIFFYYVVYKMGLTEGLVVNEQSIMGILSDIIDENTEIKMSSEKQTVLWNMVISDENYSEILKRGGQRILASEL